MIAKKHLHVIDEFGNRKVVSWKELNQLNKDSNSNYRLDMSWYNEENGYITSKQLINKMQNNGKDYINQ